MFDASIPLSIRNLDVQPAIKNFQDAQTLAGESQVREASLRDMAQQRDIRAEQLKSAQLQSTEEARQAHEDQTLRGLLQINDVSTPGGQVQLLEDAKKLGLGHKVPEIAAKFQADAAAKAKAQKDAEHMQRAEDIERLDMRARLLSGVKDEEGYQRAAATLKKFGDDLSGLEPTFDPAKVKAHVQEALSYKEQAEQEHKAAELEIKRSEAGLNNNKFDLEKGKAAETARHNMATEGIERGKAAAKADLADPSQVRIPGLAPIPGVAITKDSVKNIKTVAQANDNVKKLLGEIRDIYSGKEDPKTGKRSGGSGTEFAGNTARTLASKIRQLQLTIKGPEFVNLGVLAGPDLMLLEEMLPNPTSLGSNLKSITPFMGDPVLPQLNSFEEYIDGKFNSALERNGFQKAAAPAPQQSKVGPSAQPVKTASGKTYLIEAE